MRPLRRLAVAAAVVVCSGVATAHGGAVGGGAGRSLTVPTWLFVTVGGGVVAASFLLTTLATDRAFVAAVHEWRLAPSLPSPGGLSTVGRVVGVAVLLAVVVAGYLGPRAALANPATVVVWVGWWAGYTMTTYLVGNTWPALNPWRTLASLLPSLDRGYPERLGSWPAVVGLLALVWLEVVSPIADVPRLLATVVLGYTAVTLAGAATVGVDAWFRRVDPVARVFRYYGRVAPLHCDADGRLRVRAPGMGLVESRLVDDRSEAAFVVALVWVTTFDGLVGTPAWREFALWAGELVAPALLYPTALVAGYLVFLGAFAAAVVLGRRTAETTLSADALARRFAPSLVAIAAGYHLAHYLGLFVSRAPALVALLPGVQTATASPSLPGWFGGVVLGAVLAGHLLAVWVAHSTAFDLLPGRLQAIRSQYALTGAMVFYTMTALWIVSRPYVPPPFV